MKEIVELLARRGVLCRKLKEIEPRELASRKRIGIYLGVEVDDYYCAVFAVKKKSRILRKEAGEFLELQKRLQERLGARIRRNYLLYDAPLCSKAAAMLEEEGWRLIDRRVGEA